MFLNKIVNKYKELWEDGEFVDENETEILQSSFWFMRLFRMIPSHGKNMSGQDLILFAIIMFPFSMAGSLSEMVAVFSKYERKIN